MDFKQEAIKIKEELIQIRRQLHERPEIGLQEYETSKFIQNYLKNLGLEVQILSGTGVVAVIRGEKQGVNNRTIALRSDIDGLPMEDKKACEYSSKIKGRMHACGHDAHMAILLGTAKLLVKNKKNFSGNIKLIFEPAEETVGGARFMIEEGVLKNPDVDVVCGLHVEETLDCGKIMVKQDTVNAASNPFTIKIKGSGGHGAYPDTAIDPIVMASHVVIALQTIVSREIKPVSPGVVTVASIHGGTAQNIIPEEVTISGIIRTMTLEDRNYVTKRVREIVEGICTTFRGKADIDIEESYPCLYNSDSMVEVLKKSAKKILGEENVLEQKHPKLGVESFAYFANEKPAVFYFLGTRNEERGIIHPAHSSLFDIDEESLIYGVSIQCEIAMEYLTNF